MKELSSKLDSNPLNDCHDALLDYGLIIEHPILDGQFRNTPVLGHNPKKKVGWYVGQEISISGGKTIVSATYGDFRKGVSHTFKSSSKGDSALTKADREKYQQAMEANQKLVDAEKAEAQGRAAKTAQVEFNQLSDTGTSQYLKRKQVSGHGVKYGNRFIAIPIMGINGVLRGIQKIFDAGNVFYDGTISKTGDKRFGGNVEIKGAFHLLGDITTDTTTLYFAEGYSTAAAVYEAVNIPTVCCFNATNLPKVIEQYRAKYPNIQFIIAADDDQFADTNGNEKPNTGKIAAGKAANKYRCLIVSPTFKDLSTKPTDFNDLLVLSGTHAVKQQLSTKTALEPQHQHLYNLKPPKYDPIEDAIEGIKLAVDDMFDHALNKDTTETARHFLLCAGAGTGKTRATEARITDIIRKRLITDIEYHLQKDNEIRIDFVAPTNELGTEIYQRLKDHLGENVVQRQGRNAEYCQRSEMATLLQSKFINVDKHLCGSDSGQQCEFFDSCLYQRAKSSKAQVRILNHSHLKLSRPMEGDAPDLTIIDEKIIDKLIRTTPIKIEHINSDDWIYLKMTGIKIYDSLLETAKTDKTVDDFYPRLRAGNDLSNDEIVKALQLAIDSLSEAVEIKKNSGNRATVFPRMSDAEILRLLENDTPVNLHLSEKRFMQAIINDLTKFPDRNAPTHFGFPPDFKGLKVVVYEKLIRDIGDIDKPNNQLEKLKLHNKPILLLDADGNYDALSQFWDNLETKSYFVKRKTTSVVQYTNAGFSKDHFGIKDGQVTNKSHLATKRHIERIAGDEDTLVISYQGLEAALAPHNLDSSKEPLLPKNIEVRHFNKIRGIDDFKNHTNAIIIGRNQPHLDAIVHEARCIYLDDKKSINPNSIYVKNIITAKNGDTREIGNYGFEDSRVHEILRLYREREIMQAVDRLRLIHTESDKHIHIMSQVDLSDLIEIDSFGDTKDLKPYQADKLKIALELAGGVLPKSPKLLHDRFPDLFDNIQQVKNIFKKGKKRIITICEKDPLQIRPKSQGKGKYFDLFYDVKLSPEEALKVAVDFYGIEFDIRSNDLPVIDEVLVETEQETKIISLIVEKGFFAGIEPLSHAVSPALDQADIEEIAHDAYIERQELMQEMLLEHFQDFEQDIMGFEYEYHGYMLPS